MVQHIFKPGTGTLFKILGFKKPILEPIFINLELQRTGSGIFLKFIGFPGTGSGYFFKFRVPSRTGSWNSTKSRVLKGSRK
jgi:hypothetical protein